MWEGIQEGFIREFSDFPSSESLTRLCIRLVLAGLLGGLVGYERSRSGKDAGLRTHMLVCLGTAFVIAIPQQAGMQLMDLSRVIQGVMAGIGFLGAGTIMKIDTESKIEGLTSAASIWFTAGIGVAVGIGREASAIIGTLFVLAVLTLMPTVKKTK